MKKSSTDVTEKDYFDKLAMLAASVRLDKKQGDKRDEPERRVEFLADILKRAGVKHDASPITKIMEMMGGDLSEGGNAIDVFCDKRRIVVNGW